MTLVEIKDFGTRRRDPAAPELERFSLTLSAGETILLLGEAGCGNA